MDSPVLGRASPAATTEPLLRPAGDASLASWRADGGSSPWFTVRAASVAGVRHRLSGDPCQDSFAWRVDGSRLALAVADGLSTVPGSEEAATRAASVAVEEAVSAGLAGAFQAANAAAEGCGATTLLIAVIDEDGAVALGRVGDSSAFLVDPDGGWIELFSKKDDEVLGTATNAVPTGDLTFEEASARVRPGQALVLASDGVADPWRDGPTTVAPALAEALSEPPAPLELVRLADFSRQGCHDDRTLLALWIR
jgi:serine/threonine protein phosphatase PrpC